MPAVYVFRCFKAVVLLVLLLFARICIGEGSNYVVDIEGLPDTCSFGYEAAASVLKLNPAITVRSFRRLRFSGKSDEMRFALNTGNAPDVLLLEPAEYRDLSGRGMLVDLSLILLGDRMDARVSWDPLESAGAKVLDILKADGLVFGIPARRRILGAVVRDGFAVRESLPEVLSVKELWKLATRAGGKYAEKGRGGRIAALLTADTLLYWTCAEYGRLVENSDEQARMGVEQGAAALALREASLYLHRLLNEAWMICPGCSSAVYESGCTSCATVLDEASELMPPAGRAVESTAAGMDMFLKGEVDAVLCFREDLDYLIDRGAGPSDIRFIPAAGAEYVPSFELFGISSSALERAGGEDRVRVLAAFLKQYAGQFLVPADSPMYLWNDRARLIQLIRRGYSGLLAPAEAAVCSSVLEVHDMPARTLVPDSMLEYDRMVDPSEFLRKAGAGWTGLGRMAAGIRGGKLDFTEPDQGSAYGHSGKPGRSVPVILLLSVVSVITLESVRRIVFAGRKKFYRAAVLGLSGWIRVPMYILLAAAAARLAVPAVLHLAGLVGIFSESGPSGSGQGDWAAAFLAAAGLSSVNAVLCFSAGVMIAVPSAILLNRLGRWSYPGGFLLFLPAALAGFWGDMLYGSFADYAAALIGPQNAALERSIYTAARLLPFIMAHLPFVIISYARSIRSIDSSLLDSMKLEGAGRMVILRRLVLPALRPAMKLHAVAAVLLSVLAGSYAVLPSGQYSSSAGGLLLRAVLFQGDRISVSPYAVLVIIAVLASVGYGRKSISGASIRRVWEVADE